MARSFNFAQLPSCLNDRAFVSRVVVSIFLKIVPRSIFAFLVLQRPQAPRDPIPVEFLHHVPRTPFILAEDKFGANLRSSRRGTAGRLLGMTNEHLRPLLDSERDMHLFFRVAELLARGARRECVAEGSADSFAETWERSEGHGGRGRDSTVGRQNRGQQLAKPLNKPQLRSVCIVDEGRL